MSGKIHRPTKAIIHKSAITANVAREVQRLRPDQELFAVVKANGYGHGAIASAQAAKAGGATGFCVATIDEGIELREAGFTDPILVLGVIETAYLEILSEYQLAFPVTSAEWLTEALAKLSQIRLPQPLQVHIKVDSGMGRIGFLTPAAVLAAIQQVEAEPQMVWEGLFTHFATADEAEDSYYQLQNRRFQAVLDVLPSKPRYIHVSNSATALWHGAPVGNMIRYGVALYGLNPSGGTLEETYPLQPALELVSSLSQVKQLAQGEGIGYGETYITPTAEWIGTVPIGYADGFIRKMQGFHVLVEGHFCEIVGRVCMDQIMIRLPYQVAIGTKVTIIGENHGQAITMQAIAEHLETIHYEVACLISSRVPREYI